MRTIKVGSTKFITETKSKKSNSIQLNEWVLLLLRCLIISVLVFILAKPQSTKTLASQEIAYVFEPSLLATAQSRARFENIPLAGRRLFTQGFPAYQADEEVVVPEEVPPYWQLAQQLDQIAADSVVVFVHAFAKALQGKRPTINKKVYWVPIEGAAPSTIPLLAVQNKDRITLTTVERDAYSLAFAKTVLPDSQIRLNDNQDSLILSTQDGTKWVPLAKETALNIALIYDQKFTDERLFIAAGIRAVAAYSNKEIAIEERPTTAEMSFNKSTHLIWLSEQQPPKTELRSLLYTPDALARALIEPSTEEEQYQLTQRLTPKQMVKEGFIAQLAQWLLFDESMQEAIAPIDERVVSAAQLATKMTPDMKPQEITMRAAVSDGLWILLLIGIVSERLVSKLRKQ